MVCINCARDLHQYCFGERAPDSKCCCPVAKKEPLRAPDTSGASLNLSAPTSSNIKTEVVRSTTGPGRPRGAYNKKPDEDYRDQLSTGRKRAAQKFPFLCDVCDKSKNVHNFETHDFTAKSCEWLGLKSAGGGKHPIVGCIDGVQQARHHGPNKQTMANDDGNVHRICYKCHNRVHYAMDADYEWGASWYDPHDDETQATMEELLENEIYWTKVKPPKVKAD